MALVLPSTISPMIERLLSVANNNNVVRCEVEVF